MTLRDGNACDLRQAPQTNGLSQAVSYGDDAAAFNHPMAPIDHRDWERIFYCCTFDPGTMRMPASAALYTTSRHVPGEIPPREKNLTVIA